MSKAVLEIIVNSARDLESVRLIGGMKVYVTVSLSTDPQTTQTTDVDTKGKTNPSWNFKTKFDFDASMLQNQNNAELVFELKCQRRLGDKEVGDVRVPVRDLLRNALQNPRGSVLVVTHPVNKKGSLTFSYRFARAVAATQGGLGPNQQQKMSNYALRLQELGILISAAALAEKLFGGVGSDASGAFQADVADIDSAVEGDDLNADMPEFDPVEGAELNADMPEFDLGEAGNAGVEGPSSLFYSILDLLGS